LKKVPKNLKNFGTKTFHAFEKKVFVPPFYKKVVGCGVKPHDLDLFLQTNQACNAVITGLALYSFQIHIFSIHE